jgi:hypothetical protein
LDAVVARASNIIDPDQTATGHQTLRCHDGLTINGPDAAPLPMSDELITIGRLELVQPCPNEPRLVVTVRDWRGMRRSVAEGAPQPAQSSRPSDHPNRGCGYPEENDVTSTVLILYR